MENGKVAGVKSGDEVKSKLIKKKIKKDKKRLKINKI
jgi:hypothetical protein